MDVELEQLVEQYKNATADAQPVESEFDVDFFSQLDVRIATENLIALGFVTKAYDEGDPNVTRVVDKIITETYKSKSVEKEFDKSVPLTSMVNDLPDTGELPEYQQKIINKIKSESGHIEQFKVVTDTPYTNDQFYKVPPPPRGWVVTEEKTQDTVLDKQVKEYQRLCGDTDTGRSGYSGVSGFSDFGGLSATKASIRYWGISGYSGANMSRDEAESEMIDACAKSIAREIDAQVKHSNIFAAMKKIADDRDGVRNLTVDQINEAMKLVADPYAKREASAQDIADMQSQLSQIAFDPNLTHQTAPIHFGYVSSVYDADDALDAEFAAFSATYDPDNLEEKIDAAFIELNAK